MNKKTSSKRLSILFLASVGLLFTAIMLLIVFFMNANKERIVAQNQQYLEDLASKSVSNLDDFFSYASQSAAIVSHIYELQLDSPEFDYRLLNDMTESTPFDFIRFVSPDGVSWSGDGITVDCMDREYYTEGMKGLSGVCYLDYSRFTGSSILLFYSPLYYENEIIGVVNGVLNTSGLKAHLRSSFFGVSSDACITLPDGTIVASTWDESTWIVDNQSFSFPNGSISDETALALRSAMHTAQPLSFRYIGRAGEGNAFLAPILGGEFMLIQTLPSTISSAITAHANRDALRFEFMLIALFIVYIAVIALYYISINRRIARKNDDLNEIVDSVKRLYSSFIIFDLDKNSYEYLKKSDTSLLPLNETGSYSDWVGAIEQAHEAQPQYWDTIANISADWLSNELTPESWYTQRDYLVPGNRWKRLTLIKLDMDSEHTHRILGAVEDITDSKLREAKNREALETAFHAAEDASRAKSDFLSHMSHDIRTPMNAIVGLTAIMGAHLNDRERLIDCLAKISFSSKHLLALINEVLDMSKIESGKLSLADAEFSLPSFVDDLLGIVQPTARAKHQTVKMQIKNIVHENVLGDNLRLQQVCVNILSNAVKYTGEGGCIRICLSELPEKHPLLGEYEFVFEDNGIGMTPEFLERLFTPFERAEDERISSTQGTGLGMSIAQSIVHLMGGTIQVESELGRGTRFTVRLPLKLQEHNEELDTQLSGLPILVADDDPVACETVCLMLAELGMDGEWVLTGSEAVSRAVMRHDEGNDFFAVILDWQMPEMDGVETARAIRAALGPDIPIIILSAFDWSDIETEARAAGVNAFIGKPLFKSRLRGVFSNLTAPVPYSGGTDPLGTVKSRDYTDRRILLFEDNDLNQEIAKEILEMTGVSVDIAENGKVGLDIFSAAREGTYSLIFMDIQMPIMNGYEAARAIRALPREDAATIPIVAMSANTFTDDIHASLAAGMNGHIGKPLDIGQLMEVLDAWLA